MASRLQTKLLLLCKKNDLLAWSNNANGYGLNGLPDVFILKNGRIYFVEIKEKGDRISPIQEDMMNELTMRGFQVYIVRSDKDIKTVMKNILGGSDVTKVL